MRRLHLWLLALLTPMLWGPRAVWLSPPGPDQAMPVCVDLEAGSARSGIPAAEACLRRPSGTNRRLALPRRNSASLAWSRFAARAPWPPGPCRAIRDPGWSRAGRHEVLDPYCTTLPPPDLA